jgi:homoserine dehydrogenase
VRVHPTLILRAICSTASMACTMRCRIGDMVGAKRLSAEGRGSDHPGRRCRRHHRHRRNLATGGLISAACSLPAWASRRAADESHGRVLSEYYLRFSVLDQPGVLSNISGVLGRYNISIASVIQKGRQWAKRCRW